MLIESTCRLGHNASSHNVCVPLSTARQEEALARERKKKRTLIELADV